MENIRLFGHMQIDTIPKIDPFYPFLRVHDSHSEINLIIGLIPFSYTDPIHWSLSRADLQQIKVIFFNLSSSYTSVFNNVNTKIPHHFFSLSTSV